MKYENVVNTVTLTFDDGKANVVGPSFLNDINAGLDRAQEEAATAVILRGREGMFSGGVDLKEFEKGAEDGLKMVQRGFELLVRLYSFFLTLGICILAAVVTGRRTWYYPPILLLSLAAIGRLVAWLVHDAVLAPQIWVEVVIVTLLLVASRRLPRGA